MNYKIKKKPVACSIHIHSIHIFRSDIFMLGIYELDLNDIWKQFIYFFQKTTLGKRLKLIISQINLVYAGHLNMFGTFRNVHNASYIFISFVSIQTFNLPAVFSWKAWYLKLLLCLIYKKSFYKIASCFQMMLHFLFLA